MNEIFLRSSKGSILNYHEIMKDEIYSQPYRSNLVCPNIFIATAINYFNVLGLTLTDKEKNNIEALTSLAENIYCMFIFNDVYYLIEKPVCYFKESSNYFDEYEINSLTLHRDDGPALIFYDNSEVYYLSGRRVSNDQLSIFK